MLVNGQPFLTYRCPVALCIVLKYCFLTVKFTSDSAVFNPKLAGFSYRYETSTPKICVHSNIVSGNILPCADADMTCTYLISMPFTFQYCLCSNGIGTL